MILLTAVYVCGFTFQANVLEKSSSLGVFKKTVTIRAWKSPSLSYLQVSKPKAQNVPAKVSKDIKNVT